MKIAANASNDTVAMGRRFWLNPALVQSMHDLFHNLIRPPKSLDSTGIQLQRTTCHLLKLLFYATCCDCRMTKPAILDRGGMPPPALPPLITYTCGADRTPWHRSAAADCSSPLNCHISKCLAAVFRSFLLAWRHLGHPTGLLYQTAVHLQRKIERFSQKCSSRLLQRPEGEYPKGLSGPLPIGSIGRFLGRHEFVSPIFG